MHARTAREMEANGANVVWIDHNNSGIVDADKVEPGLSYAVYEAFTNSADDLALLCQFLVRRGNVVTWPEVGAALADAVQAPPELTWDVPVERQGNLYVAQKGIAVLFEDAHHDTLSDFWREVLGQGKPQPGYRIATEDHIFHYHTGAQPASVEWRLPFEVAGYRYDNLPWPAGYIHGAVLSTVLSRRARRRPAPSSTFPAAYTPVSLPGQPMTRWRHRR